MRGHGTALAHLLFLAARRRPHEFGLHGCLLRSHPLTLPTAPISFNFLAVNDIGPRAAERSSDRGVSAPALSGKRVADALGSSASSTHGGIPCFSSMWLTICVRFACDLH